MSATSSLGRSMAPPLRSTVVWRAWDQRRLGAAAGPVDWRWNTLYWWQSADTELSSLDCGGPVAIESCERPSQIPASAPRMRGGTPPRTTHDLLSRKICYRFHPLYGAEVEVIRCLRKSASVILIVKFARGMQIAVPEWMLNPQVCDQLKTEDKPRISVGALMDLRRLIDAQSFQNAPKDRSCAESPTGGKDAQQRKTDRVATSAALRRRRDLERASRVSARTVPNAMAPGAGQRSQSRRREAE